MFKNNPVLACHCGDPRFPVPTGSKHCRAADSHASELRHKILTLFFILRKMSG